MPRALNFTDKRENVGGEPLGLHAVSRDLRFTAPSRSGVPSRAPRALAAAKADPVRSEIASRSDNQRAMGKPLQHAFSRSLKSESIWTRLVRHVR
jgi:hypothetical protein